MRRVQLVLLCEDTQHEAFCRRFLNAMGWETRAMRVEKAPAGRGAAAQFVRMQFPKELRAHRSRPVNQVVVVVVDGNSTGVEGRVRELGRACRDAGVAERAADEAVALFFPTWNIETWLAYLDGAEVDEGRDDYPKLERERECQRHVHTLVEMCRAGALRKPSPPSLDAACEEYQARLAAVARG